MAFFVKAILKATQPTGELPDAQSRRTDRLAGSSLGAERRHETKPEWIQVTQYGTHYTPVLNGYCVPRTSRYPKIAKGATAPFASCLLD